MRYHVLLPLVVVLTVCLPLWGAEPATGQRRLLAVEDLNAIESTRTPVLSPEGDSAVSVPQWIDRQTGQERSSLWLVKKSRDNREALEPGEPGGRAPQKLD